MRGKHAVKFALDYVHRITPADAGKTDLYYIDPSDSEGSPPRMRGKQIRRLIADTPTGITPADAGKTTTNSGCSCKPQDHPRGCGENYGQ